MVTSLLAVTRSKIVANLLAARSREARGSLFKIGTHCGLVEYAVAALDVAGVGAGDEG